MKNISFLFLALICLVSISSCRKDSGEPDNQNEKMIVGKNWKLTAYTEDGDDVFFELYDACERDNIETFFADKTFKIDEGATKCDPSDPQTSASGNWSISGNKLTLSAPGLSLQFVTTIIALNSTTLKYSLINPFGGETLIFTYTAQ